MVTHILLDSNNPTFFFPVVITFTKITVLADTVLNREFTQRLCSYVRFPLGELHGFDSERCLCCLSLNRGFLQSSGCCFQWAEVLWNCWDQDITKKVQINLLKVALPVPIKIESSISMKNSGELKMAPTWRVQKELLPTHRTVWKPCLGIYWGSPGTHC